MSTCCPFISPFVENAMSVVNKQVEHLLGSKCPIQTLSDLLGEVNVSAENRAELEDIVSMLEIHEHEIRSLKQSLNLRLRNYSFDYYKEYLIKKNRE